jgi:hypothetical protein
MIIEGLNESSRTILLLFLNTTAQLQEVRRFYQ